MKKKIIKTRENYQTKLKRTKRGEKTSEKRPKKDQTKLKRTKKQEKNKRWTKGKKNQSR